MSLGRRLIIKNGLLITGIVVMGAASLWGLHGLRDHARVAREEYIELRLIQRAGACVEHLYGRLQSPEYDRTSVDRDIREAVNILGEFVAFQETQDSPDPDLQSGEALGCKAALNFLATATKGNNATPNAAAATATAIEGAMRELSELARQTDATIAQTHDAAAAQLHSSIIALSSLVLLLVGIAVTTAIHHHRTIMSPLRRLQHGVRTIATGSFSERVALGGDVEFVALAEDFNCMAAELEGLYQELEKKVRDKSRELVKSERLASVGFLAAGVAHEINNPLNIISGYAELALARQRKNNGAAASSELCDSLQTIRDEAFRCKEIVEKLISLSRMGDSPRTQVSLAHVADDVAFMVRAVKAYQGRRVELVMPANDDLSVMANETEMKQVLINLVFNALSAVTPDRGCVKIEGTRQNGSVLVRVSDNGRGMTPEILERVFEPFYTQNRDDTGRGLGLGLSIVHAIVEAHGGQIEASSAGPDQGSTFTIRLTASENNHQNGKPA